MINQPLSMPPEELVEERRAGETTFQQCGWCMFARGERKLESCRLRPWCGVSAEGVRRHVNWDQRCEIPEDDRGQLIEAYRVTLKNRIHGLQQRSQDLMRELEEAEDQKLLLDAMIKEN